MNKYKIILLLLILLSLSVLVSAAPDICQAQFTIGSMNQTQNQTACTATVNETFTGAPGTPADVTNIGGPSATIWDFTIPGGVNGTPGTPGAAGAPGAPGGAGAPGAPGPNIVQANVTESNISTLIKGDGYFVFPAIPDLDFINNSIYINNTFFLTDASRPLTSEKVKRDVDNDLLSLYGGNAIAGGTGGIISLFGNAAVNPNAVEIVVGDGAVGNTLVTGWVAGANPRMDMNGFNISSLLDPIANQDAATRNWVLVQIGNISVGSVDLSPYLPRNGTQPMTGAFDGGGNNATNLSDPRQPQDAVTANYLGKITGNISSGGGTGGAILYFHHETTGDPAWYEGLSTTPAGEAEVDESVVVNAGLGVVKIDAYVTDNRYHGITTIPAGLWRFRTFHYINNAGGNTQAVFKVYNRTAAGAETYLFTATSVDIDATTTTEYLTSYVQTADYVVAPTDRIVINVSAQTDSVSSKTFHFVYEGSTHTSHVQTPIETLSSLYIMKSGAVPFTGSQSMDFFNLTNVTTVAPGDAVCKTYVDTAIAGISAPDLQPFAKNDTDAYWANGSRPITDNKMGRDVDTNYLSIRGGNLTGNSTQAGSYITLFGGHYDQPDKGNIVLYVPTISGNFIIARFTSVLSSYGYNSIKLYDINISGMSDPIGVQDATTKRYVDNLINLILGNNTFLKTVSATNPNWDAKGYNLTNLNLTPTSGTDAATKNYVDIQKANDTSVDSKDATVKAYTNSNNTRWGSSTLNHFFLANETVFSNVVYPLNHVLNSTTVMIDVICIGGGGGSGGVTGLASNAAGSGGGGAGGYAEAWFSVVPSTTVWIGVGGGGVGGAAGNNNGLAGKPSNLTVPGGTKWINCSGGLGGTGQAAGTTFAGAAGGIGGGTVVMGAVSPQWINYGMNQTGMNGYRLSATAAIPGSGGSTTLGDGARPPTAAGAGTACPPGGYGGGAAGALSTAAVNQAGGAGCPGAIIVREYAM